MFQDRLIVSNPEDAGNQFSSPVNQRHILYLFARGLSIESNLYGLNGRILRVNLSDESSKTDSFSEDYAKKFIGGKGFAIDLLYKELSPGIKPLGPENKLVFSTGPLNATGIPGDTRFVVAGKSPLTGIWGEGNCSGWFADSLKKSGYDALVVEGTSKKPVYIWINDDVVEVRPAEHLWGKWTLETEKLIKEEVGINASVVAEGPAAENLVAFSAVTHTAHRAAGRTGLGAVMGSKKLKAIAALGTGKVAVANPDKVQELRTNIVKETFVAEFTTVLREHGQAGFVMDLHNDGILPTRNFQSGVFDGAKAISGQTMTETILKRREACPRCPVACKRMVEVTEGPFAPVLPEYGGPEYENVAALGSLLGVDRLDAVCRMNMLCNAYSLDTISAGVCIAWAMECFEAGIITTEDTDGLELTFGNAKAAVKMVEKIALKEGFGAIFSEGLSKAAEKIGKGSERFAVEVKRLELPMHEPRGKKGLGLMYAVSNRGGCHMQSMHDPDLESPNMAPEIGISVPLHRLDTSRKKVIAMKKTSDWTAMINSTGICSNIYWFGSVYYRPLHQVEILNAVTGWGLSVDEYMNAGERINTYCRAFNAREGVTRNDDKLPHRLMEPLIGGPTHGQSISQEELDSMLDSYYEICGWDKVTGIPTKERLNKLGLGFINL
ncbi:aldehyde ferredoxin oxidoreductase [Candidatus Bathyarchaeota archaeon]|nr:aldehyde ferredoxin oxidoreductase [Candidatus Bathyarchaeota archaeon]